eukprot:scaffold120298_cov33-Tisochrysis_lutea.AAC.1
MDSKLLWPSGWSTVVADSLRTSSGNLDERFWKVDFFSSSPNCSSVKVTSCTCGMSMDDARQSVPGRTAGLHARHRHGPAGQFGRLLGVRSAPANVWLVKHGGVTPRGGREDGRQSAAARNS